MRLIKLRDYQLDLINDTRLSFACKLNRPLVVLGCGGGKTVCFAYMALSHINKNPSNYVWFLVHRKELIDQTLDTFKTYNIDTTNIFVGMVQTVTRHCDRYRKPTLIIIDEAHHSSSQSYVNIISKFSCGIVGLTATPIRLDGKPLGNIYNNLINGVSVKWLIKNNFLAPYEYYAPKNLIDGFKSELDNGAYLFESKIYGDIKKYIEPNSKIIIYCPNIAFSQALASEIGGVHFDGNTPKALREKIICDFRQNKIKILCNVDLIGEGFDVPDCDCVFLLRPTMSTALFIQQSMRCMRYKVGKVAKIYDFVGNCFRHGLPDDDRDWSLDKPVNCRNKSAEPDILVRQCKNCFKVYSGVSKICPYCQSDNGLTRKQIECLEQEELERVKEIKKKEVNKAVTLKDLLKIEKERGYKRGWAIIKFKNSWRRKR